MYIIYIYITTRCAKMTSWLRNHDNGYTVVISTLHTIVSGRGSCQLTAGLNRAEHGSIYIFCVSSPPQNIIAHHKVVFRNTMSTVKQDHRAMFVNACSSQHAPVGTGSDRHATSTRKLVRFDSLCEYRK